MKKSMPLLTVKNGQLKKKTSIRHVFFGRKFVVRLITWHPNSSVPRPWRKIVSVGGFVGWSWWKSSIWIFLRRNIYLLWWGSCNVQAKNPGASPNYDRPLRIQENLKWHKKTRRKMWSARCQGGLIFPHFMWQSGPIAPVPSWPRTKNTGFFSPNDQKLKRCMWRSWVFFV